MMIPMFAPCSLRNAIRLLAVAVSFLTLAAADELPKGQIVDRVVCAADSTQSYALYVPTSYVAGHKVPVLYCLDPGANGRAPVERFQAAAEKYGYLVVGSNNSRNGPFAPNYAAVDAMLRDTSKRFAIDRQRIYLAGFSGGARVACQIALTGLPKGVIACGAGFPGSEKPAAVKFAFFGTAGVDDFNYQEMRTLDGDLQDLGAPHRLATFAGGHDWLPAALATEAIEWFELQAMRAGLRSKDEALIQTIFQKRQAALASLPVPEAYLENTSLAADFAGLADTAEIAKRAKELAGSHEVRAWKKQEQSQEDRRTEMSQNLLAIARNGSTDELHKAVDDWRKRADAPDDSPERRLMRRVLEGVFIHGSEVSRTAIDAKEYNQALPMLELMAALQPGQAQTFYDLACAHALNGEKRKAVEALKQAATDGFKDAARVEAEPAFARLHADAAYQAVLATMKL
jgi:predicted esterase